MDRAQFINLVNGEQEQLRKFLLALCTGKRDEADDIAQEALVKAYLSSSGYQDEGKFTAWLYKIAYNTFVHPWLPCRTVHLRQREQPCHRPHHPLPGGCVEHHRHLHRFHGTSCLCQERINSKRNKLSLNHR